MKLTIYQNGSTTVLEYSTPTRLSTLFAQEHIPLSMPCGGRQRCRKCAVIAHGALSPLSEAEASWLTAEEIAQGVRYACMTTALGDAELILPDTAGEQILTSGELADFSRSPWAEGCGAAFDIGTTTVAAYLYDLDSGALLAADAEKNPQAAFGADVISRISHAVSGGGSALAEQIHSCANTLLARLCRTAGVSLSAVQAVVFTGNTAMEYFLLGADPSSIAQAPFIQDRSFGEFCPAAAFGLSTPNAKVYITKCISAYVGGDITSGILSSGMLSRSEPVLLADIGTNGELALAANGKLLCCSTAAGPAFEGAGIRMGMTASEGAISHVRAENGALVYETIGGGAPRGICGSGIIDAVAACLSLGYLDETGAIDDLALPDDLFTESDGTAAIRFPHSQVVITQKDIRAVQLAKSAICAGMEALIASAGLRTADIARLLIAGGFGSVLDTASAQRIGLIPAGFSGQIHAIGNAAGMGAVMQLLSRDKIAEAEGIAARAQTLELSTDPVFRDAYIENMLFPES